MQMIVAGSRGGPYFRHHSSYEIFFIHSYPNDVTKATL
jgi:hypothetical protein